MNNNTTKNIVLIGAGNVATHLGMAFRAAGLTVRQVYSRTEQSAAILAGKLDARPCTDVKQIEQGADLYLISVPDKAVPEIVREITPGNELFVHTSGNLPLQALEGISTAIGVFYPLQTFSKQRELDYTDIPFCLEANDSGSLLKLRVLAEKISGNVFELDSIQRKHAHLAAVFACNFANHLYRISDDILRESNIPFELLKPLIRETASKVKDHHPAKVQTGPAIRHDMNVIEEHLNMLEKNESYRKLYELISKDIFEQNKKKDK